MAYLQSSNLPNPNLLKPKRKDPDEKNSHFLPHSSIFKVTKQYVKEPSIINKEIKKKFNRNLSSNTANNNRFKIEINRNLL